MISDLLVLTAAVTPDRSFAMSVGEPAVRLDQYRRAISAWLRQDRRYQIVVVETTGADPDAFGADVRVVSFAPSAAAVARGKGAVEADAVDRVIAVLAGDLAADCTITKVTGRLRVTNADRCLRHLPPNSVAVRRTLDRSYCDSRLFQASVSVWRAELAEMGDEVDDGRGRFLEHVLAHRLVRAEFRSATTVLRFPARPRIVGMSATSGAPYGGARRVPLLAGTQIVEQLLPRIARKQV